MVPPDERDKRIEGHHIRLRLWSRVGREQGGMELHPVDLQPNDAQDKERETNDGPTPGNCHSPVKDKPQSH